MKKYIVLLSLIAVISLQGMKKLANLEQKVPVLAGAYDCQNQRDSQQDRFRIEKEKTGNVFFGVFDGHDEYGHTVAQYIQDNLYTHFNNATGTIEQRLEKACQGTNNEILNNRNINGSGSTATIAYVDLKNNKLYLANVGDSRTVVARGNKVLFATKDHKCTEPGELARIQNLNGTIINGRLADCTPMTRAFGDEHLIRDGLIATPDVEVIDLEENDIIIAASDGVWDKISSEKAIELVNENSEKDENILVALDNSAAEGDKQLSGMAEKLARKAINLGSKDNIAVIVAKIIALEKVKSEWNFVPSFVTNSGTREWFGGIVFVVLIGGLVYYLSCLR